jgi:hypothetical protein
MSLKELISCLIDDEMKKSTASHDQTQNCSFLADYGGGTNVIYKAYAKAGTFTSEAKWQIAMINYDANGNVLSIQWPINSTGRSSSDFEFIWNNRATYSYSS